MCLPALLPKQTGSDLPIAIPGVYHTSVKLSLPLSALDVRDPQALEFAFGGHDDPRITGVFSVPAGTAAERMPGLRYYREVPVGRAFGREWDIEFGSGRAGTARRKRDDGGRHDEETETVYGTSLAGQSRVSLVKHADGRARSEAPDATEVDADDDGYYSDGGLGEGIQHMSMDQRRAWRTIEDMRRSEEWRGTRYSLLSHNCNSFTAELVYRLTGKKVPAWINRAAWVRRLGRFSLVAKLTGGGCRSPPRCRVSFRPDG